MSSPGGRCTCVYTYDVRWFVCCAGESEVMLRGDVAGGGGARIDRAGDSKPGNYMCFYQGMMSTPFRIT